MQLLRSTFVRQGVSFYLLVSSVCLCLVLNDVCLLQIHLTHIGEGSQPQVTLGVWSLFLILIYVVIFFYIPPPFKDKHNLLNFAILFLLHRNIASQTVARLKDVARRISSCLDFEQHSRERSASLDLLLRFQRLLISKLYPGESVGQTSEVSSKLL